MKVPPLWFCAWKLVTNIALSTPVLGYKPSRGDRGSYSWAPFEDHYTSLTSQEVQHRFFPGDDPSSYHPHPQGLTWWGTHRNQCVASNIDHSSVLISLQFPHALWGLVVLHLGKKVLSACPLLPTVFRCKHQENHNPALHKVNQLCIEY